jgi:SCP-2 sterol transfer family
MSTNQTNRTDQATRPHTSKTARPEIAAFFRRAATNSNQPRLRGMKGTVEFVIHDAGTWRVSVDDGRVTMTEGGRRDASPADSVLTCTADDFLRIVHEDHHLNFVAAALQGRLTMSGNLPAAWMLVGSFEFEPQDIASH